MVTKVLLLLLCIQFTDQNETITPELAKLIKEITPTAQYKSTQPNSITVHAQHGRNTVSRLDAIVRLGELKKQAAPAVTLLGELLADPMEPRRFKLEILRALARIGAAAQPALSQIHRIAREADGALQAEAKRASVLIRFPPGDSPTTTTST